MYNFDLVKTNATLVKVVRLLVACRRMIGKGLPGYEEVQDIEREVRLVASECQRVIKLIEADGNRPLINS